MFYESEFRLQKYVKTLQIHKKHTRYQKVIISPTVIGLKILTGLQMHIKDISFTYSVCNNMKLMGVILSCLNLR